MTTSGDLFFTSASGWIKFLSALIMVLISGIGGLGCTNPDPIHMGFVGGLTGRVADLGIAGRDGALLAVEQINQQGGLLGRPLVLSVEDDQQNPKTGARAVNALINTGSVAIIGHMTSSMSLIGAPIANRAKVLMLSPTTSTNDLSQMDDYFFRIYPASADAAETLADHAYSKKGFRRINIIFDMKNQAHTQGWYMNFKDRFEGLGGKIDLALPYTSGLDTDFKSLARQLRSPMPHSIFILANAMDTAMLCQQIRKQGPSIPVLVSEWSATQKLIKYGGKSVNGIEFLNTFDKDDQSPGFLNFSTAFKQRFGYDPGFASTHAFDTVHIIKKAIEETQDPARIKEGILTTSKFTGLQGKLTFDPFGDIKRPYFLMTINNGRFKRVSQ